MRPRRTFDVDALVPGIHSGDRTALGQAITLVESRHPAHRQQAQALLLRLGASAKDAVRLGITGVPGVGKSTFIEAFGMSLLDQGRKVAVLAVDPSSSRTGGSIMADKTRMQDLSRDPRAFVRPSPSAGTLGGVTRSTRETMLCSSRPRGSTSSLWRPSAWASRRPRSPDMVDFFLVLMLAGAGDEFQGIKKGVLELADMLAVNKADGDNLRKAREAASRYRSALTMLAPRSPSWRPPVQTCSALERTGLAEIWETVTRHRTQMEASGQLEVLRASQRRRWMWAMVQDALLEALSEQSAVAELRETLERQLDAKDTTAPLGAQAILDAFRWPP